MKESCSRNPKLPSLVDQAGQKPIKRTALGSWLKGKAPHILDNVGDLLPDRGDLCVLKWILNKYEVVLPQQHEIWITLTPHLSLMAC